MDFFLLENNTELLCCCNGIKFAFLGFFSLKFSIKTNRTNVIVHICSTSRMSYCQAKGYKILQNLKWMFPEKSESENVNKSHVCSVYVKSVKMLQHILENEPGVFLSSLRFSSSHADTYVRKHERCQRAKPIPKL